MFKPTFEEFIQASADSPTVLALMPEEREKYTVIARKVWEESSPKKVQELMTQVFWTKRRALAQ
jgi:hypothetical protein